MAVTPKKAPIGISIPGAKPKISSFSDAAAGLGRGFRYSEPRWARRSLSFTMLHHVLSPELQDRLFGEAHRVLRPGGVFAGSDSTWSMRMWMFHFADTMVTLDPKQLPERLKLAGFEYISVGTRGGRVRFQARRAAAISSGDEFDVEAPGRHPSPA